ncbi:SDR family NAD(P)-dependent oxidoreductase [Rhodococcus erythropolis]
MSNTSKPGRLEGKICLITGAAGGIGRATCELFESEGARVFATDILEGNPFAGTPISYYQADIADAQAVSKTIESIRQETGRIDVLVNNAGITGPSQQAHEISEEDFDKLFAINVRGPWLCTRYTVPIMKKNGGGSIINMSSINGLVGGSTIPVYHSTKGAIRLMTKADAISYAQSGIRVNSIHPGSISTPLALAVADGIGEEFHANVLASHPLGRRGEPMEVAYGILFLASDEASFVTGIELPIDGGFTAR